MSALQAIAGQAAEAVATRLSQAAASSSGESKVLKDVSPPSRATAQDSGVQATFSPQSLKVLEDAALGIAGTAKDWVQGIGDAGNELVSTAADAVDELGAGVAGAITSGADALVKGVGAARAGVNAVATAASDAVADATDRASAAVESTVGYAALAALAGGALLNELV